MRSIYRLSATKLSLVLGMLSVWVSVGCAGSSHNIPGPDPSDPNAPIGVDSRYEPSLGGSAPEASSDSKVEPRSSIHRQHGNHEVVSEPEATVYACPVHSDVHNHEASQCPRCGKTLVPQLKEPQP